MKHTILGKYFKNLKTKGFIELKGESNSLTLKVYNSSTFRQEHKELYLSILKLLGKYYLLMESGKNIGERNSLQPARRRAMKLACQKLREEVK